MLGCLAGQGCLIFALVLMHPNLQVENEETIEALSARTKALLDRIQQRFYFVASVTVLSLSLPFCVPFVARCFPSFHLTSRA